MAPDLTAKSDRELGEYRSYLAGPVLRSARNSIIRKRKIMASIAAVDREFAARAAARRNGAPRTLYN